MYPNFLLMLLACAHLFSIGFRSGLNHATVAFETRNLLVWGSSYKNYMDPETMGNIYATPIPRSFVFSLNFNF